MKITKIPAKTIPQMIVRKKVDQLTNTLWQILHLIKPRKVIYLENLNGA